ncbi:MAG: hypothetical protein ABH887_02485 [bacterium]
MPRRKIEDRNIRKLGRTGRGRSIFIILPIEMIRELGWREKQKVVVNKKGKTIVISDWEK